jgi:hypothetical protein
MNPVDASRSVPLSAAYPGDDSGQDDIQASGIQAHERAVLQAIRETAFGTVEVTVHQSRIVQITRSEKLRL